MSRLPETERDPRPTSQGEGALSDLKAPTVSLILYWEAIRRHWRLVAGGAFLLAFLGAGITLCLIGRVYRAEAVLLLPQSPKPSASIEGFSLGTLLAAPNVIHSYRAILESRRLGEKLVDRFDLQTVLNQETRLKAVKALSERRKVEVDIEANTILIQVELTGTPRWALFQRGRWGENDQQIRTLVAELANAYVAFLRSYLDEIMLFQAQKKLKTIERLLDQFEPDLEQANQQIERFQRTTKMISVTAGTNTLMERMAEIQKEVEKEQASLRELEREIEVIRGQLEDMSTMPESLPEDNPFVQQQRKELQNKESQLALKRLEFGEKHPDIKRLELEIQHIRERLREEVERQLEALQKGLSPQLMALEAEKLASQAKCAALQKILTEYDRQLAELPAMIRRYNRLQLDSDVKREVFLLLAKEHEQAQISAAEQTIGFEILDAAVAPEEKVRPKTLFNTAVAAFLGFCLCSLVAINREVRNVPSGKGPDSAREGSEE